MIKLTKQQIEAVSNKIHDELEKEIREYNKEIRKVAYDKFFKTKEGKAFKLVNEVGLTGYNENYESNPKIDHYLNLKLKYVPNRYSYNNSVKNDIVLATIECDDVEALIEQIKKKYAK